MSKKIGHQVFQEEFFRLLVLSDLQSRTQRYAVYSDIKQPLESSVKSNAKISSD